MTHLAECGASGNAALIAELNRSADGLVQLFEQLPGPLQMDGLDLLQGVVNTVMQKITGGRVTAVKFVPVGGANIEESSSDEASISQVMIADRIKQEIPDENEPFDNDFIAIQDTIPSAQITESNISSLDDNQLNHDAFSGTNGTQIQSQDTSNNPTMIISEVFSTSPKKNKSITKKQSAKNSSQEKEAVKKKTAPRIRIKLCPKKTAVKSRKSSSNCSLSSESPVLNKEAKIRTPKCSKSSTKPNAQKEKAIGIKGKVSKRKSPKKVKTPVDVIKEKLDIKLDDEVAVGKHDDKYEDMKEAQLLNYHKIDGNENNDQDEDEKKKEEIRALFPADFWASTGIKKRKKIEGEARFECTDCEYKTNVKFHFDAHRIRHTQEERHTCNICNKVFTAASTVKRHMLTHKDMKDRPHSCPVCPKKFCDLASLRTHAVVHTGEKLYSCPFEGCDKVYTCHSNLSRHKRVHTGAMPYVCKFDDCEVRFRDQSSLKLHHLKHTGEKPCACKFCGMAFRTSSDKLRHERTHTNERNFECKICHKKFVQGWHVKQHMKMHEDARPFACELCDKRLRSKSSWEHHMRAHAGIKRYKCDTCSKLFTTKTYLENHQVLHTKAMPYKCRTCDKRFNQISNLKRHERMHSDVMRYTCKYCQKGFKYINSYRYHVESIHEGVKHTCEKCGVSFQCKRTLKFHKCSPAGNNVVHGLAMESNNAQTTDGSKKEEKSAGNEEPEHNAKRTVSPIKLKLTNVASKRKCSEPKKKITRKKLKSPRRQIQNSNKVVGQLLPIKNQATKQIIQSVDEDLKNQENVLEHVVIKQEPEIYYGESTPNVALASFSTHVDTGLPRMNGHVSDVNNDMADYNRANGVSSSVPCGLELGFSSPSKGRSELAN